MNPQTTLWKIFFFSKHFYELNIGFRVCKIKNTETCLDINLDIIEFSES